MKILKHFITVCLFSMAALLTQATQAMTYSATDINQVVVDNGTKTETVNIAAGANDTVQDINLNIDMTKCGGILTSFSVANCTNTGQAFPREISLVLTDPMGNSVNLITLDTYSSNLAPGGRIQVTFNDSAANAIGTGGFVGGTFYGVDLFSLLQGDRAQGNWLLQIGDDTPGSPFGVSSFKLNVTVANGNANVPEPASLSLLFVGLIGMGWRRFSQAKTTYSTL